MRSVRGFVRCVGNKIHPHATLNFVCKFGVRCMCCDMSIVSRKILYTSLPLLLMKKTTICAPSSSFTNMNFSRKNHVRSHRDLPYIVSPSISRITPQALNILLVPQVLKKVEFIWGRNCSCTSNNRQKTMSKRSSSSREINTGKVFFALPPKKAEKKVGHTLALPLNTWPIFSRTNGRKERKSRGGKEFQKLMHTRVTPGKTD